MNRLTLIRVGAWGPGYCDWARLRERLLRPQAAVRAASELPPSQLIPPRERRRAPLTVRLALEAASQAVDGSAAANTQTVFASGMGDTAISDYMCRTLAVDPTSMSPTQFHNSVHNAPSGYWSIATSNHCASNSISAFYNTFAAAFVESATLVACERAPVLLILADIATRPPLQAICDIADDIGVALLLAPNGPAEAPTLRWRIESMQPRSGAGELDGNCAGAALRLLAGLARGGGGDLCLPVGERTGLRIAFDGQLR